LNDAADMVFSISNGRAKAKAKEEMTTLK